MIDLIPWIAVVATFGLSLFGPLLARVEARPVEQAVDAEAAPFEPVRCWRRTSAEAVRVGEHFTLVLTCALLDTESTIVVADETKLDPAVMPVSPFEVLGTRRAADVLAGGHRFLQVEFDLRLINEGLFGQDVKLPEIPLEYRVQTRVEGGALSEGLAQTYVLPPHAVRVLSLVPGSASDIRDASARTFSELETASLRARLLVTSGGVLIGLATVVAAIAIVRTTTRKRAGAPHAFSVSDRAILQSVQRELAAVRREREASGWTPGLAGRALSGLRIAGNYLIARPTNQREIDADADGSDGTLVVPARFGERRAIISASVTAQHLAAPPGASRASGGGDHQQRLPALQTALLCLTRARYARPDHDTGEADAALDESLTTGLQLVATLVRERHWIPTTIRRLRTRTSARRRWWP